MALDIKIKKRLGDFLLEADFKTDGARLALLGASGSGKSVTLRCIAGILTPDEGRIIQDGKTLFDSFAKINLKPQARQVGYLFQQYALFPNMTAKQNLRCAVRNKSRRTEIVQQMARMCRLEDVLEQKPAQLSGGQQQRLALARILASEPKTMLLDEPFSALDSFLKAQLEQELCDLLDAFSGDVLWVSHDRDEVFRNCGSVCVMEQGKTSPVVTPHELFYSPETASAAKLSGCKNILPASFDGNVVTIPQWGVKLTTAEQFCADAAFVGLRAHLLRPCSENQQNAICCRLVRAMDNVFSVILILRPDGSAPDAPTLRAQLPKDCFSGAAPGSRIYVAIAPEDILVLK